MPFACQSAKWNLWSYMGSPFVSALADLCLINLPNHTFNLKYIETHTKWSWIRPNIYLSWSTSYGVMYIFLCGEKNQISYQWYISEYFVVFCVGLVTAYCIHMPQCYFNSILFQHQWSNQKYLQYNSKYTWFYPSIIRSTPIPAQYCSFLGKKCIS